MPNPILNLKSLRILVIGLIVPFLASISAAQTLPNYLHLRRYYHIRFGASEVALETKVGTRVLEVKATINGIVQVGNDTELIVQDSNGGTLEMKAAGVPSWVEGSDIVARLLVRAYRATVQSPLEVRLLGVAPETDIEAVEKQLLAEDELKFDNSEPGKKSNQSRGPHNARQWILPNNQVAPYYASFIRKDNPRLGYVESMKIANEIIGFGDAYGVDPRLIMAMVMTESDFNPKEHSHAGAMGLGQLMPCNVQDLGLTNPWDTTQNLYGTVKLVRQSLLKYRRQTGQDFQGLVLALASYNAGDGAVKRYGGIPPYVETQNYVKRVLKRYYRFCGYQR